jgi:Flp pilus assembly pilin Flp
MLNVLKRLWGSGCKPPRKAAAGKIARPPSKRLWQDERGQDLIEYTLLLAFVALASAAIFVSSGAYVSQIWSVGNSSLSKAAATASGPSGG